MDIFSGPEIWPIEMTTEELEQRLAELFGANVAVCLHRGTSANAVLFPDEEALIATAVEKRRLEFATGRDCARKALAKLGASPGPILAEDDRSPIWPPGFVGSISHMDAASGAVAARAADYVGLGFDIESAAPLPDELMPLVWSRGDREHFGTLTEPCVQKWGKIAFCAKEAFYKCQYPLTRQVLDFRDISIRFSCQFDGQGTFLTQIETGGGSIPDISGFWLMHDTEIYAGARITTRR